MSRPPKAVVVPVYLQRPNPILRIFGGPNSAVPGAGGAAAAADDGGDMALEKRSAEALRLALEKLVLPHDTLILLLLHPPPPNESAERLKQSEEEMQKCLRRQLRTQIDVASAQNIAVHVVVKLRTDRAQTLLNFSVSVRAAIVVVCRAGTKYAVPAGSEASEVVPEALAQQLPSTCKVMVVHKGKIEESLTGEISAGSGAMSLSSLEHSSLGQLAAPVMNRAPSGSAIPEEVLREVYGETEFSVEEVLTATNSFGESNQIGVGGSGSVYWGQLRGRLVAVKRLRWWGGGMAAAMSGDSNFRQFLTELRVMRRIRHRNLLELQGVCVCATELLLVFNYQHNGSLDRRLRQEPVLTWNQRLGIALGAAAGLQYLHSCSPPIIHRDVKTANILLDQNMEAQMADFGLAKIAPERDTSQPFTVTSIMGTQGYLAPEYGHSRAITKAIDVFAFGVVLLELVTGHVPFRPDRRPPYLSEHAFRVAMDGDYLRLLDPRLRTAPYDPEQLKNVLMLAILCLSPNPAERPRMDEVVHLLREIVHENGRNGHS